LEISKMARNFTKKITAIQLAQCFGGSINTNDIESFLYKNIHNNLNKALKDITKIQFDFENIQVIEISTFNSGLSYVLCCAGGDWEAPVYFYLYYDGKDIRGYTPTNGNTFHKKYKTAYGSLMDNYKFFQDYPDDDVANEINNPEVAPEPDNLAMAIETEEHIKYTGGAEGENTSSFKVPSYCKINNNNDENDSPIVPSYNNPMTTVYVTMNKPKQLIYKSQYNQDGVANAIIMKIIEKGNTLGLNYPNGISTEQLAIITIANGSNVFPEFNGGFIAKFGKPFYDNFQMRFNRIEKDSNNNEIVVIDVRNINGLSFEAYLYFDEDDDLRVKFDKEENKSFLNQPRKVDLDFDF